MDEETKFIESTAHLSLRTVAALEVITVLLSALALIWIIVPLYPGNRLMLIASSMFALWLMIHSHRVRGETLAEIGFTTAHFGRAMHLLAAPTIIVIFIFLIFGYQADSLRLDDGIRYKIVSLPLWGLAQQYILQGFVYRRIRVLIEKRLLATAVAATIFAIAHLPNPALTIMTLIGGLIWSLTYERAPNLFALGLSHGLMSLVAMQTLPTWAMPSLSVGYKYLLFH